MTGEHRPETPEGISVSEHIFVFGTLEGHPTNTLESLESTMIYTSQFCRVSF